MDRFEVTLKFVANPDQFMIYTAFIKRLMHDHAVRNHLILNYLVVRHIEKYQDAQLIIFCFMKLKVLKRSCLYVEQD